MTHIRFIALALLTAFLVACGGGGSTSNPVAPADFSGIWNGSSGGTAFVFSVVQTGSSINMTRTTPVSAGLTYTGAVNGNSAAVTTYINGVQLATSTITLSNSITATMTVVTCTPTQSYTCGTPGLEITLTRVASGTPMASTLSFPMLTGYKALVANGLSKSFSVSGTCTGSGTKSSSTATTAATFEGVAGLSATSTLTMSLTGTGCSPSLAQSSTAYFDTNYIPRGFNSVGVNYGVYLTPLVIPASVSVGSTAIWGTETLYTDSTKATGNGRIDQSYVIEADTANTAIVNLIAKIYNAAGTLTATEQGRYRMTSTGTLTPISIDIQYANTSTAHLVLTF